MANFMGPMAPPQAAPNAPPQLDIRTNPSQRAQFKEFMQGMNRPVMPPTTAPIAPMLPAPMPSPMDQIDIFAPVPMANGGVADPYAMEGKIGQSVGPKMVGGTTNVIDASGNDPRPTDEEVGVLAKQLQLGQDLYDVNQSYNDPGRPMFGMADLFAPGGALSFAAPSFSPSSAPNMMQNAMQGILGATQMDGPMSSTIGIRPVARDGNLGIMANFSLPFEDGGPVGMQRGGVTFKSGRTYETGRGIGEQNREMDALERGVPSGVSGDDPYDEFSGGGGDDDGSRSGVNRDNTEPVADALATIAAMDAAQESYVPGQVTTRERPLSEVSDMDNLIARNERTTQGFRDLYDSLSDISESAGDFAGIAPVSGIDPLSRPDLNFDFGSPLSGDLSALSEVEALIGPQPRNVGPADTSITDFLNRNPQPADSPLMTGTAPLDDFLARNPQPRETDPINPLGQLMAGDVVYNRGKDNERTVSRFADLENRMGIKDARVNKGQGLSALAEPIVSKIATALGGSKATDIFDNVVNQNKQAIIAADTNQIVGYADDGPFGRVYTGRAGYNPFGADGSSYTVDPQTGALIVNRKQENQGEDDQQRNRALPTAPPADDAEPVATFPDPMIPPVSDPLFPAPTPNVVVPSTRTNVPVTVPSILPTEGLAPTVLPQSFLDLLASFNRPAPRAMQDGGAVLDKAADDFLEALRVA